MAQQKQKQFKRTNTSANKTQSVSAKSGVAQQNQVVRSNPTVPAKTGIGQQATREIVQRQIRSDALNKLQNVLADGRVNGAMGGQTFIYRNSANMNTPQRMIRALDNLVQEQNRQDRQQRFFDRTDEEGRGIRRQLYNLNQQGRQSFNADFNPVMSRKADIDIWRQGATPQDIAKADEYRRERNAAEMQRSIDDIRELANRHPALVGTPVSTFGGMVGSAITPIATLGAKIRGDQDIDVNDPIYRLSRQAEAAREGTMQGVKRTAGIQDFDENGNRTFASQASDFLVGTGLSMSDTLVRSAFMGPLAGAAQAGFSAASQRFIDGKMNGEDDRHALASALAQGVAEDFFEKYSLEGLHALKSAPVDGLRSLLLNMGKQGFTEGSEEFATDWANAVSDYFINGGDSEWVRGYNECRQAGMTDEQAIMSVAADTLKQSLISFGGGALSGILLGGGAQLANRSVNNQLGQQLQNEGQGYTSAELAEIAQNMDISPENFTDVRGNLNREALEQAQDAQAYLEKLAKRTVDRELTPTETGAAYRAQSDVVDATVNNMTDAEIENLNEDIEAESNRPSTYWSDKAENRSIRDNIRGGFDENGQKAFDALSEEDAVTKARPFAAYYNNGRFGTEVSERMEELGKEVGLTADEISAAVRAGAADANKLFPTQESIHLKQTTDGIKTKGRQGKVKYQGIKYGDLTTQQKMRADFTSAFLNKGLGMDVVFVRSNVVNGKYQGFNGAFEVVNGRPTITIDVNAGMNAETDWTGQMSDIKTLLPVVSHELTHYFETANSEAYHQIAQEVINALQSSGKYSKGLTFNEILNEERIRLEQTEGRQRTNTDAMHEIVARACEDMLSGNKEAMEAFEKMKPATRKTIADHIKDIFDNIRDFFEQMLKGYRSDSSEAKAIRSNMEKFEKIRDMWNQAINDSLSIVQADDAQTADTSDGMQAAFSMRQFAQSLDYDLLINKDGLPFQIIDPVTQQPVTHVTEEHMQQTPMGVLVNAALANGTIDSKTASKQLKMFTDLMNLTLKYDDTSLPMVWEIAGTYLFSSVKTNSDAQYSTTVDYGTICSKTQALIDVLSNTMVQKGRGLTREEVMTAYNRTARQGLSVPCPVCYVFSRWMGVPSLLETMRNCQERFGNASKAEIDSYIKSMVKEYGDAKAINSEKTKVQNRMATLERKLQKASADKDTAEEKKIAKETQELQQKLTDLESFNWVTQVRCKSDGKGGFIPDPAYKSVPNDILLDLRKSGDFASKYPKAWKYRTTRGAGMGKAIMPYSGASIGDFIKGNKDRWSDSKNPFTTKNVKSAKSAVARAVIRAKAQNLIGGQRFQSTSDYRAEWGIDYLMTFLECQAAGSQVQLYTKVIEAVDMLASAGAECNLSIMPKDNGYIELANGKKQLVFSDVTGINFNEAYKKTTQYDNVQMILVGINDEHIRLAMADDRITFIIPWHSSGNSKDTLAQLMESVGETLDVAQNVDYSDTQTDKVIDNSPHMQRLRQFRKEILQGKLWDNYSKRQAKALTAEQNQLLDENAYLKELYRRFYQDESAQEYGVKLNGKQVSSIFPYEYWDKSLTIKDADQNGRRFQDYCASLGIQPRFSQFSDDHGYWKLLIDRKMYNVDGTYHTPEAINVTNVKVEQIPMAVNSNNYKDMDKIAQATRDTLMALDGVQNDLQAVDEEDEADTIDDVTTTERQLSTRPSTEPDRKQYSLRLVDPIVPSSDDWKPGFTTEQAMEVFPNLWNVAAEESDTKNPTSVKVTLSSYKKIYDSLKNEGFNGTIMDASSGLGYGTEEGINKYGFDVEDIEPYPGARHEPTSRGYSTWNKTYDVVISNAVLNVLPQEQRDAMTVKIGEMLNPGGKAFVNVRSVNDVKAAKSKLELDSDNSEFVITNTGSYQKGFKEKELVAYLKDVLGDGYTVVPATKKFGSGSNVWAEIYKDGTKANSSRNIEQAADDPNNDNVIRQGSDKDIQYSTRITDKNINDKLKVYMATFFSGTGTVDFALRNIVRHEFAVEYDAKIAAVYRANNGDNIYVNDVRDVDINPHKGKVEYFHASPVCKSYSNANNDQGEKPLDIETAQATADAIDTLQPKVVTVENVAKYRNSEAIKLIEDALEKNGYEYDKGVYRASDFGGATIRERMFLRAVKDGVLPEIDTSEYEPMSWYEAVEDLIPSLPKAEFSNYMEERLDASGIDINNLEAPIFILGGNKGGKLTWASADEPAPTILAKSTEAKIVMTDGSVLRATPRVMARIQGLPDSFDLKDGTGGMTNAYKVVGNGVPVQLTQGIVGPLLEQNLIKQKSESTGIQYSIRTEDGEVYRGLAISDKDHAYSDDIINRRKKGETRWKRDGFLENVAKTGERIALVRTGANNFKAYTTTKFGEGEWIPIADWERRRKDTRVPFGSDYDVYNPDGTVKIRNGKPVTGKYYYPFIDQINLDEEVKPTSHSPRYARFDDDQYSQRGVDLDQRLDDLIQTYGALPKGEMAVNDISVPQQTSNGKRVRRYARTVLESGVTSDMINDEIKEKILKEGLSYEPVTDKSAAEYAASVLRIGGVTLAQKEWDKARRSDTFNKDHMAVGQELLREYAKQGDVENVINMVTELAAEGTRMGQNIQAMRMLKKYATQAPAVGLGYIQRTVDIMNREAKKKMGKRYKEMKIDQQLADAYINASTKDEIDAALAKIYINLGSQVQKTAGEEVIDRLRTWRYMSMLGNPRTHVRNLVGNALFVPAVNMKNIIGATIESTFRTKERTKSLITSKAARQFAAQDAIEMQDILQGNADKSIKQRIMDERKTFTLKPVNVFSKLNGDALEAEDWVFLRYHYQNALAQYITANKLNPNAIDGEDLAKARQYAVKEAQKATYRDANKVSTWLNQSKGAGAVVKYMMEGMMPFKKTPTNILRRGIEYSPAMIVGSLTKGIYDLNHGNITVNEWIDGLSSGLTGTAIFGLGLFLASTGAILGGYKDDDDKEKRKLKGEQEYAVKIGNHTYTIDWAAPGSLPLFVGVETMYALRQDRPVNMDDISKAAARLVDPMINMSMLSGLNDTLDAISYADDKLSTLASETFFNLLGQYVPTLFGQVARTMDTTQRVNYQDVNKGMPKNMLYFLEKMQNKIPYMTFSNDPYLDAFGRENTTESRFIAALQNFVFPWYTSELSDDRVVRAVTKLQDRTDENVLPQKMPKYFGQGDDRMDLTSRQYYRFQKTAGTMSYNIIDSMLDDDRYLDLNADQQAEAIKMGYDYAKAAARLDLQPEYELKGNSKKIYEAYEENGTLPYDTILDLCMLKNATEGVTGDPDPNKDGKTIPGSEKKNMINAILESDGSATDKAKMYEMSYPEDELYKSWKKSNYSGVDYMKHYSKISTFKGDDKQEHVIDYIKSQTDDIEKQKLMFQIAGYKLDSEKKGVVTKDGNFNKKMGY